MLTKARNHLKEIEKQQKLLEEHSDKSEVKRLEKIKTPLVDLIDRLKPNEDEAAYFRSLKVEDDLTVIP